MADDRSIETYRSLRDTIKNASGETPIRSVLLVDIDRASTSPVARRLALAFGVADESCVLVDTNFRTTSAEQIGLSDLIGSPDLIDAVIVTQDHLVVVEAGTNPNPDLLASRGFGVALESIQERHEYTVLTCEPYPQSSDVLAVAPLVDAVILVISAGETGREPAIRARDALERVGARILGLVMIERPRRWF